MYPFIIIYCPFIVDLTVYTICVHSYHSLPSSESEAAHATKRGFALILIFFALTASTNRMLTVMVSSGASKSLIIIWTNTELGQCYAAMAHRYTNIQYLAIEYFQICRSRFLASKNKVNSVAKTNLWHPLFMSPSKKWVQFAFVSTLYFVLARADIINCVGDFVCRYNNSLIALTTVRMMLVCNCPNDASDCIINCIVFEACREATIS